MSQTFSIKQKEIQKNWIIIDADSLTLGRLSTEISRRLMGKHNPQYTPHMDMGDNIVVTNARKVLLTGKKMNRKGKLYYRHTGFPGGIKETDALTLLKGDHPERVLKLAVRRMLPKNKLSLNLMKNLYIYPSSSHKHEAQKPILHEIKNYKTLTKNSVPTS